MTHDSGNAPDQRPARKSAVRRRALVAAAVLAGGGIALTACGGHGGSAKAAATPAPSSASATASPSASASASANTQIREDANAAKNVSAAKITITPKNGSTGNNLHSAKVTVTGGTLTHVTMTAKDTGATVAGAISADGHTWTPSGSLSRATQYHISAQATDAQGRAAAADTTFATTTATSTFVGYFTPEDGSTVGVGMPVSINFDKPVDSAYRASVERGISVQSTSGQQVVGHWFNSKRLDLRPQTYWQPGSHVSLTLNLSGVKAEPGVYGVQHKTVGFDVGRSQVSTVDTKTHMMTVVRDGQVVNTLPISAGADGHTTYDGQMVISEKDQTTRMNGATVGFTDSDGKGEYDIPDVPHAMRLSNSGTFIHGNYWGDKSIFGKVNTSHGCIGLSDTKGGKDPNTDAAWFYNNSLVGDVVIVKNSPDKTIQPSNGLNGWNMSWAKWVAGSAVYGA
ncbi:L,D-transpeptidase [Actinacidiphila rubida]|uniref:Lipoprotein-anchoring transpeptidase ErfK/SrfK n=1 Tax=Actinacidiphila rubida TaxID=310780 RepID=A0A1H8TIA0_9ACTN|nr:Ig-like domain-containing protein [Actinacidiphila rubida]SEO90228.1 Lipoprotein-anchoring transpeptidase ErfK/SrfK [Actinacidiphila rubida]